MKTLINESSTTLVVTDHKRFLKEADSLTANFNKTSLMDLVKELSNICPGPYRIELDGKEVPDQEVYVPHKKHAAYKMADAAAFVALFFHNPENMAVYWSKVPKIYKDFATLLAKQGYINAEDAGIYGFGDIVSVTKPTYRYNDPIISIKEHTVWFSGVISVSDSAEYWKTASYVGLKPYFAEIVAESLDVEYYAIAKDLPGEWKTECAEAEAISSVPVIAAAIKQGSLKFSEKRVTAASSWKFMKSLPIKNILPDFTDYGSKINAGESFLPLFNAMTESTLGKASAEVLKAATERLFKMDEDYLVPMLMPHIKGFKSSALRNRNLLCRAALMEYFKEAGPEDWVALDPLITWLGLHSTTFLEKRAVRDMYLEDTIYGGRVTLDRVVAFDRSIIGSLCTALYCMGMVEVALAPLPKICTDPYTHVSAVRLTALGRYALGFTKKYVATAVNSEPLFELDDNRLIIRSLKEGNPYESLLPDTASAIGGGRFLMSPESFLKNCSTAGDVVKKVDFFHQYICPNPPGIWNEFFKTIERRCNSIKDPKEDYYISNVDPADTYLLGLLTSDPVLKDIVIRAEGYRILIPESRKKAFENRLKSFGYLL